MMANTFKVVVLFALFIAVFAQPRPIPVPIYGVTADNIANLSGLKASLSGFAKKPTVRIVFDSVEASYYLNALQQLYPIAYIMGEILDSTDMDNYNLQQFSARVTSYVQVLGQYIDIWEIGNEVNGEWNGNSADVSAKLDAAYNIVKQAGYKTAITLYYNGTPPPASSTNCFANPANSMFVWANNYISSTLKTGVDYVLVSYYEVDCENYQPDWNSVYNQVATMFPNSLIGQGECGTSNPADSLSLQNATLYRYYTRTRDNTITAPRYIGGYFWWYYYQTMIPTSKPLWIELNKILTQSPTPTLPSSPTPKPTSPPTSKPTSPPTPAPNIPTTPPTAPPTSKPSPAPTTKPSPAPTAKPTPPPTAKPSPSATPAPTAKPNFNLYVNGLASGWQDWSWSTSYTFGFTCASPCSLYHSPSKSIRWTPRNWEALSFAGALNTNTYKGVQFWINGGSAGSQDITFDIFKGENAVSGGTVSVANIPINPSWTKVYVPFNVARGTYDGFWLQDNTGGTQGVLYIDDIALVPR